MKRILLAPGLRAWIRPGDDGTAHCLWDEGAGPAAPPLDWATVNAPEPEKEADNDYSYVFAAWIPALFPGPWKPGTVCPWG